MLGLQGQCIGNGILTVENEEQARVRAEDQDKGGGAAAAALHLLRLSRRFARPEKSLGFRLGAKE
jgi:6,7-dimethyl-8-ribityllumazine synthase